MCAGLPIVATAVGGVPEQVADGVTGLLVPPRSPAALAAALHDLSWDSARRAAMGRAARDRVTIEFSTDRCVAAFERIYGQLADRNGLRCDASRKSTFR